MRAKTPDEIEIMRTGGQKLAQILQATAKKVVPGVTPKELTVFAAEQIKLAGLRPALLGYEGFSDVMCVSINEGIVHGLCWQSTASRY